jgi:hypothetical protein
MATVNTELNTDELQQRVQQISDEARALGTSLESTVHDLEATLRAQMERRPYVMLAAAAGVGYVLGGGLPSRVTSLLIGLGSRVLLETAARDLTARFGNGGKRA